MVDPARRMRFVVEQLHFDCLSLLDFPSDGPSLLQLQLHQQQKQNQDAVQAAAEYVCCACENTCFFLRYLLYLEENCYPVVLPPSNAVVRQFVHFFAAAGTVVFVFVVVRVFAAAVTVVVVVVVAAAAARGSCLWSFAALTDLADAGYCCDYCSCCIFP